MQAMLQIQHERLQLEKERLEFEREKAGLCSMLKPVH